MEKYGKLAFDAYRESRKGLDKDGKPIPEWDELSQDVQIGWCAAGEAVFAEATKQWIERTTGVYGAKRPPSAD